MNAVKYEVKIVVEVLSLASIDALVVEALRAIRDEKKAGSLSHDDGDFVKWSRIETTVDF